MNDKTKIKTLEASLQKSQLREQFLRDIIIKFHSELSALGLQNQSEALHESMCVYASDWQASIDQRIEYNKRQGDMK